MGGTSTNASLLTRLMGASGINPTSSLSGKLYLEIGTNSGGERPVRLLILKTFDPQVDTSLPNNITTLITQGISRPADFYLSNYGVLKFTDDSNTVRGPYTHFMSDILGSTTITGDPSLAEMQLSNRFSVYGSDMVISPNLLYLLYKKNGKFYLLYNQVHRPEFKTDFENAAIAGQAGLSWGQTTSETDEFISTKSILQNYCKALRVPSEGDGGVSRTAFLDPTCNLLYSRDQCATSSAFEFPAVGETTDGLLTPDGPGGYTADEVELYKPFIDIALDNNAGNPVGDGESVSVTNCMCTSEASTYADDNGVSTYVDANGVVRSGFIGSFQNKDKCDVQHITNFCNQIFEATTINVGESELINYCGNQGFTEAADKLEEEQAAAEQAAAEAAAEAAAAEAAAEAAAAEAAAAEAATEAPTAAEVEPVD